MIRLVLLSASLLAPVSTAMAEQGSPGDAPPGSARAVSAQPMVVTSDTDAYCESLSRQIDRHGDVLPQPVASLREQGLRLCATGQVRGGINRLRRALLALHASDDPDQDEGEDGR